MQEMENKENKKKRKQNFTVPECTIILEQVERHLDIIRGKHSNAVTNARKQKAWQDITRSVNSLGYAQRTAAEVRDKWRNLTQQAKKQHAGLVKARRKTGGGPCEAAGNNTITQKIIDIFQDEPSFSGITDGYETSVFGGE